MKIIQTIPPPVTETRYRVEFTETELILIAAKLDAKWWPDAPKDVRPVDWTAANDAANALWRDLQPIVNQRLRIIERIAEKFPLA